MILPNIYIVIACFSVIITIILLGYGIVKIKKYSLAITFAWLSVFSSIFYINWITLDLSPLFRMLVIILSTLFSMKIVVTVETYKMQLMKLSFIQWVIFVVAWFGMRPKLFETYGNKSLEGAKELIMFGLSRLFVGLILIFIGKYIYNFTLIFYLKVISIGVILMGISFILHFGILNISAGSLRLSGVDTRTLFKSPYLSKSLNEFWGKRWNLAFSEMTALAIYRPLKTRFGAITATLSAFIFSGFLHEIAISFPVNTNYGLPMLYFVIHGIVMLLEKYINKSQTNFLNSNILSRIWVMFWLIVPMPLLFHKAFIKGVVLPIINALPF